MQTFLPYPDFRKSLEALDKRRLGKQRVEASQIIAILKDLPLKIGGKGATGSSWRYHPVTAMWRGYANALVFYYNTSLDVFAERGGNNILLKPIEIEGEVLMPPWVGDNLLHRTHRSQLLLKSYQRLKLFENKLLAGKPTQDNNPHEEIDWYRQFKWKEIPGEYTYIWPNAMEMAALGTTKVSIWLKYAKNRKT